MSGHETIFFFDPGIHFDRPLARRANVHMGQFTSFKVQEVNFSGIITGTKIFVLCGGIPQFRHERPALGEPFADGAIAIAAFPPRMQSIMEDFTENTLWRINHKAQALELYNDLQARNEYHNAIMRERMGLPRRPEPPA